ncbi:hypothetical protein VARIO8X_120421 [Burkholderiales bacterium 8X]|nr:hypothetical protein VARIO8X_120421 [Burkholderiales bacterium 8X]
MDAGQGRGGLRRARGAGAQGGDLAEREPSRHHRVVHGPDPAHHRQRDRAGLVHPAAGARQHRAERRRRQHLPRPRQRAGRDRRRPQPGFAAGLLRPGGRFVAAFRECVGRRLRLDQGPLRIARDDDQARHHGLALDRRRAREERDDRPGQQPARGGVLGPRAQLADPRHRDEAGDGQARSPGGGRPVSVGDRGHGGDAGPARRPEPEPRGVPAAGLHAVRDQRFGHGVQPLAAVAREGDRAALGEPQRPHDHAAVRRPARLRQGAEQELQDGQGQGHGRALHRRHPARDQPLRLDHRLHRPESRAAAGAHAQHERFRRGHAPRQGGQGQGQRLRPDRRLLRPAVALLGHARVQASGQRQPVRHLQARDGRRRQLPRELRRRAGRQEPAGRGRLAFGRCRHHHRLSGARPPAAQEARLVGRTHRRREAEGRRQELEDRQLGRHDPRLHEEPWLPSLRQCQGEGGGVELPGRHSAAPRAALRQPARPDGQVPDARRQDGVLAPADALQDRAAEEHRGQGRREVPVRDDLGPPGRVRGRRRRDSLEPVAGRAAAGDVHRDQPEGRGREEHPQRRARLGQHADRRAPQRAGAGHRAGRARHRVHALPLLGPLAGAGHAGLLPEWRGAGGARRGDQHRHHLRLRQRHDDARDQEHGLQHRKSIKTGRIPPWQE